MRNQHSVTQIINSLTSEENYHGPSSKFPLFMLGLTISGPTNIIVINTLLGKESVLI